jgi:hypothetical protein
MINNENFQLSKMKLMMKKNFLIANCLMLSFFSIAQTESFDIASFVAPKGWQRIDTAGVLAFVDTKTTNGLTSFCQIFLFPSYQSNDAPAKNFETEWNNKVIKGTGSTAKPSMEPPATDSGWTVVTGHANITQQGITYTTMLVTASGFGKTMSIVINLAGQDYVASIESFLNNFELDKNATSMRNSNDTKIVSGALSDYKYLAPEGWQIHKINNAVVLSQYQTLEYGCLVTIYPPQSFSGDLETVTKNIFSQRYPGWEYRSTGENHDHLSKGYTAQGLEYCMVEADMKKVRPDGYYYDYEDGAVWVIKYGNQIAVVTGQHNRNMACFCKQKYEYWNRFFNSFTINNFQASKNSELEVSKRIIGDWISIGSSALNEYLFAANGNYQYIGAYATTTKTTDAYYEYTHINTSAFKGDGSYSIKGNQLIFKKYGEKEDPVQFRFEKVNHGGTGWKDRLYMLKTDNMGTYEVCYEKKVDK